MDAAYQLLINEGYLQARGPAGTHVAAQLNRLAPVAVAPSSPVLMHSASPPLPLQMGLPALDLFPRKLWTRLASRALRSGGLDALVYPDACGHGPLRMAVAGYLGISRGIACTPGQVFICAGYRAALALIGQSLMQPGDRCWYEDPGYFLARDCLRQAGATLVPVPVDEQGLDVEHAIRAAPDARFAVVTPSHQSPLGVSLSLPRRQALLKWAHRNQRWIIEDDYDSEYRYHSRPLPALKSLDAHGRVLYCGTFSKVLNPGLRLAYLVVPQAQVAQFSAQADLLHNHSPVVLQAALAAFIEQGHFARHLKKMRSAYAQRRQWLVQALRAVAGERLHVDPQAGGMHLLAGLPASADDRALAASAQAAGLAVQALSDWYQGPAATRGLLMGFTNVTSEAQAHALARQLSGAWP